MPFGHYYRPQIYGSGGAMEKDNSVKIGVTKCDYCDAPSVIAIGPLVLCNAHKSVAISLEKEAEDGAKSLKAAPIHLADQHKQKK